MSFSDTFASQCDRFASQRDRFAYVREASQNPTYVRSQLAQLTVSVRMGEFASPASYSIASQFHSCIARIRAWSVMSKCSGVTVMNCSASAVTSVSGLGEGQWKSGPIQK